MKWYGLSNLSLSPPRAEWGSGLRILPLDAAQLPIRCAIPVGAGTQSESVGASRSQSEHRFEEAEVTVRVLSAQPCLAQRRAEMLCSLTVVHALLLPRNHLERRKEGKKGRNPCSWEAEKLSREMEDIHRNQTPGCKALLAGDRQTHYPLPSCLVQGQLAERRHLKITAQNRPWGQSPADGVCVSEGSLRAGAP